MKSLIVFLIATSCSASDVHCEFQKQAGRQQGVLCHNGSYDLTVPEQCLNGTTCGVVVDVHGLTMNGTWEEAITQTATLYAAPMNLITLQPSASLQLPPLPSWGSDCPDRCLAGLDDVTKIFNVDKTRLYFGGSSQGGECSNGVMNGPRANEFAAFTVGAAFADIPKNGQQYNFLWYIGRYDDFSGNKPSKVEPQLAKFKQAWGLTSDTMVDVGKDFERHSLTNDAKTVEVQYLVHNYTLKGFNIPGSVVDGHCAPGGIDAAPNPAFAHILGMQLRLSCPQPNPQAAEKGSWAGHVTSTFYANHQLPARVIV